MLNTRLKSHIIVEYKWMVPLKLLTVCMVVAAVYAFVSVNRAVPVSATSAQPPDNKRIQGSQTTDDAKLGVIKG